MSTGPDPAEARRRYDEMAESYDRQLAIGGRYLEGIRARAVSRLGLSEGATVLDLGCGTGASFRRLARAVGPTGRVVGVDQSAGMLDVARRRIAEASWPNVELIEAPLQDAQLPSCDAALFFFTHDLLRTPEALDNVVDAVRAGGTVATAGMQRPSIWMGPLTAAAWVAMRRYVTTREGLSRPWDLLMQRLADVAVERRGLGAVYVASGRVP